MPLSRILYAVSFACVLAGMCAEYREKRHPWAEAVKNDDTESGIGE